MKIITNLRYLLYLVKKYEKPLNYDWGLKKGNEPYLKQAEFLRCQFDIRHSNLFNQFHYDSPKCS